MAFRVSDILGDLKEVLGSCSESQLFRMITDSVSILANSGEFDPNDPVVNTASEYMYQMATISYHVLHSTVTVVLDEPAEYEGVTYEAGPHEFAVDGRYYADFDRNNPIEGPARGMAWSPTALGLIGQLGVGTVTASTLQMSLGLVAAFAAVGAALLVVGIGLVWVTRAETVKVPAAKPVIVATPA